MYGPVFAGVQVTRNKLFIMPIYAYKCESCGFSKDVLQKMSDTPLSVCPQCNVSSFKKQLTAAGFQLKGSGWYVTDFRGGNNGAPAGKPTDAPSNATDATGKSADAANQASDAGSKSVPPETTSSAATPAVASGAPTNGNSSKKTGGDAASKLS